MQWNRTPWTILSVWNIFLLFQAHAPLLHGIFGLNTVMLYKCGELVYFWVVCGYTYIFTCIIIISAFIYIWYFWLSLCTHLIHVHHVFNIGVIYFGLCVLSFPWLFVIVVLLHIVWYDFLLYDYPCHIKWEKLFHMHLFLCLFLNKKRKKSGLRGIYYNKEGGFFIWDLYISYPHCCVLFLKPCL